MPFDIKCCRIWDNLQATVNMSMYKMNIHNIYTTFFKIMINVLLIFNIILNLMLTLLKYIRNCKEQLLSGFLNYFSKTKIIIFLVSNSKQIISPLY